MNLFDKYRKSYIAVCFAIAAIYAFALGENLPILFRVADVLLYGIILCAMSFVLWNIFRFSIPANYVLKYRLIFLPVLAVFVCLFVVGIESFVLYLCFPSLFGVFVYSIAARLFITFLLFIIIRLFYISYYEKKTPTETLLEEILPETATTETVSIDRITVRSGQSIKIIPIDEIIFVKADGDYISIHTDKGYWMKEQTMKYTEETLPTDRFVRIHRSYIVNINFISRIERYGYNMQVVLHNNEKIKISAARYQSLKQLLGL